jgi:hypothetical protein
MLPLAIAAVSPRVLIIYREPAAAGELCELLHLEGVSTRLLTMESLGTPDTAAGWILQLDPAVIIVDIPESPDTGYWSHLLGLRATATRHRVPFVITTRSKQVLAGPVPPTGVITITNRDDRKLLATCIARMIVPAREEDRLELRAVNPTATSGWWANLAHAN